MKLTPKQEMFCNEYMIDLNGTRAAIRAGYAEIGARVQATRMLAKPNIKAKIKELTDARSKKINISAEYVLTGIVDTVERCRQHRPVLDKKGQQVFVETPDGLEAAAYEFDSHAALKGFELLGKHLKMFTDKVMVGNDPENPIEPPVQATKEVVRETLKQIRDEF